MKKKIIVIIVTVLIIIALISVIFFRPKYRTTGHIFCMMDNNVIELEGSFLSLVTGSNGDSVSESCKIDNHAFRFKEGYYGINEFMIVLTPEQIPALWRLVLSNYIKSDGIYEGDIIFTNEDDEVVIEEIPHY